MAYGARGYAGLGGARYQGDPFLGGFIKTVGKVVGGAAKITSKIVPGPLGGAAGILGGVLSPSRGRPPAPPLPQLRGIAPPVPVPGLQQLRGQEMRAAAMGACGCPSGWHNAKDAQARGMCRCVRNRRMNPTNPRALRRAIRREESFIRLARRTGLVTVPKAKRVRRAASRGRRR